MAGYLVLARKYRSATFDEVVGQDPIAQTLTNAIKTGRVAHAYLFTGTRGVGKTTMARILAKALNCLSTDEPTPTPCNKCDACISIGRGDDVDVIEIDGASNRGIDQIRELRANAIFRPARSRYKIYYIDEVHMLTKEAFNALLKTLEEPPEHVKFIFATTEAEKVPATILSRCQRFDFRNIPTRQIADHLAALCKAEEVDAEPDALFRVARAAAGSMRDGLSLLDQLLAGSNKVTDTDVVRVLGTPADQLVMSVASAIAEGDTAAALGGVNDVLESGVSLPTATAALSDTFRNMMLAATCGGDSSLIELPETQKQAIAELAKKFSVPTLVQAVSILQTTAFKIRTSSVARALLEAAVVRLSEADKFVDPASLIDRIETLAGGGVPTGGLKKNAPLNVPAANKRPAAPPPQPKAPDLPELHWNLGWLEANWSTVVDHMTARRQVRPAGLVREAKVKSFADGVLTLAFDAAHESLRQQCLGPIGETITATLSELADRAVRCEFVAAENNGNGAPQRAFGGLSTAEKSELAKDPAITETMSLFGGTLKDLRQVQPPAVPAPADNGQNRTDELEELAESDDIDNE